MSAKCLTNKGFFQSVDLNLGRFEAMILDPSQGSSRQLSRALCLYLGSLKPGIFFLFVMLSMFFVRDAIFTKLQEHPMSPCMSISGIIKR